MKFPIDFDTYNLGDVIAAETIEIAYGVKRDDRRYRLSQLAMANACEASFMGRGQLVTIKAQGDALAILTHPEASVYNESRFKTALRAAARSHARHSAVDMEQLPDDESRVRHAMTNAKNGRTLQAVRQSRRIPSTSNVTRLTPGRGK